MSALKEIVILDDTSHDIKISYGPYENDESGQTEWLLGIDTKLETVTFPLENLDTLINALTKLKSSISPAPKQLVKNKDVRNSKEIMLTKQELRKLVEIYNHFSDIDHFKINTDNSNGIGEVTTVKFSLFDSMDTCVDITDVSSW
jgi:hypothetical protein